MCLGVPGKVVRVDDSAIDVPMGRVDFGGVSRDVCLAYVPDVRVGDYVIVHVGFAISVVDAAEAHRTYEILREMNALEELDAMREAEALP
jgi:hydrogenase expression/formation protein HypC